MKLFNHLITLAVCVVCAYPYELNADSSDVTKAIINEPVSLMDIGVERLDRFTKDTTKNIKNPKDKSWITKPENILSDASYQFKTDTINLFYIVDVSGPKTANRQLCISVWNAVHTAIYSTGLLEDGVMLVPEHPEYLLIWAFSHNGYSTPVQTDALYKGLLDKTMLGVTVSILKNARQVSDKVISCEAKFTSTNSNDIFENK